MTIFRLKKLKKQQTNKQTKTTQKNNIVGNTLLSYSMALEMLVFNTFQQP